MKQKLKVRYRYIKLLIIIGIAISYIAFYLGNQMIVSNMLEQDDKNTENELFDYTSMYGVICSENADCDSFVNQLNQYDFNSYIAEIPIYVNTANSSYIMSRIYTDIEGELPYYFAEGQMPAADKYHTRNQVALGVDIRKYTYEDGGNDYIDIFGERYLVTGYVTNKKSVIYNSIFIFDYSCIGEKIKENMKYNTGILVVQSNAPDIKQDIETFAENLQEYNISLMPYNDYELLYCTAEKSTLYTICALLAYFFCIIILIMLVSLWMHQRSTEFGIRMLDGFSKKQLLLLITKDILRIMLPESVLLFIIQQFLHKLNPYYFASLRIKYEGICLIAFIIISIVLLVLYPYVRINNKAENIYKGEMAG